MVNNLYQIALHNLQAIYKSENESFQKEDFKDLNGKSLSDSTQLITFLIDNDFIEYEEDKKLYFLSPETYNLIEDEIIEDKVWSSLDQNERDKYNYSEQQKEKAKNRDLQYTLIKPEKEKEKAPFLSNLSGPTIAGVFIVITAILYYFSPFKKDYQNNERISPEVLKGLENTIFINEETDTIKAIKKVV